ncbi:MAG: signal peptidase I [Sphingomonas sp.]
MPLSRRARPPRRRAPARAGFAPTARLFAFVLFAAFTIRSLLAAPFSIPSESMLPRLFVGDYLVAAKWPYGWSRHSLPFSLPPFAGRIGGAAPARGDVIVFKTPADGRTDYVKRLIGLPGDRIRMAGGRVILNGVAAPALRVADFRIPVTPNSPCIPLPGGAIRREQADGAPFCRYRRYRETLPGGRSYDVLDLGPSAGDDMPEIVVPAGHYFMLGDNRDRSADSRWPVAGGRGIGMVPAANLVGRASWLFFSTDGTGDWRRPSTWASATRAARIGERLQPPAP